MGFADGKWEHESLERKCAAIGNNFEQINKTMLGKTDNEDVMLYKASKRLLASMQQIRHRYMRPLVTVVPTVYQ